MRGVSLAITALILVTLGIILLISIISVFNITWLPSTSSVGLESAKITACQKLVSVSCTLSPSSIEMNFDADRSGTIDVLDNLQSLCDNFYGTGGSESECKKVCGCEGSEATGYELVLSGGLSGDYYSGTEFNTYVFSTDPVIDYNWGFGSPDPRINPDHFSIKWSGYIKADYEDDYTFFLSSDDGSRLWIDGRLLIDSWNDQWTGEKSADMHLIGGWHKVRIDYYENTGIAFIKFYFSSKRFTKRIVPEDRLGRNRTIACNVECAEQDLGSGSCQSSCDGTPIDGICLNTCCCSGTVSKCEDGTANGVCSSTEPLYCDEGILINNCELCCPSGECNENGACVIPSNKCPSEPTYPTDIWDRVWCDESFSEKLGQTSEQPVQFDNNWGTNPLISGYSDYIGFRSGRTINFLSTGDYTFTVGSDDGVRVWIDGQLKLDQWVKRSYTENNFTTYLAAGNHKVRIDYYEDWIDARLTFKYSSKEAPEIPGLVAYWKFDESSGTTAFDSSGNGNSGTLVNMESSDWTSGKIGNALDFDGANEYVIVPDSSSLDVDYITMSAWIYVNSYIEDQRIIDKEYDIVEPYNVYTLMFSGTFGDYRKIELRITRDGHSYRDVITGDSIIPLNTWTHVAATYDGSTAVLYVNGVADKTIYNLPGTIIHNNKDVWIGASELWSPRFFDGKMDEVKIWNRALSASEIKADYEGFGEECSTNSDCMEKHQSCMSVCSGGKCYGTGLIPDNALPPAYPGCELICNEGYKLSQDGQRCVPVTSTCDSTCKDQLGSSYSGECLVETTTTPIIGIDMVEGSFGKGDYISINGWDSALKKIHVNTIRFTYGMNDPWNKIVTKPGWEYNLDAMLDLAEQNGYKLMFYTLGDGPFVLGSYQGGGMYGITDPLYNQAPMDINLAKSYIDKLAGDNALGHNFITDSRIAMFSIGNEANIGDLNGNTFTFNSDGQWMIEISQYIRSKGGKTSFPHPYCNVNGYSSWYGVLENNVAVNAIDPYVDYMDWHLYAPTMTIKDNNGLLIEGVPGGQSTYDWNGFKEQMIDFFQEAANNKGTKDINHVLISEFGITQGISNDYFVGDWTYTAKDRVDYFNNWFQALDESGTGIKNLIVHSAWESPQYEWETGSFSTPGAFSIFDSNGNFRDGSGQIIANYFGNLVGQGSYTSGQMCSGTSIGQDGCASGQTCCCSGTVTPTCSNACQNQYGSQYTGTCETGGASSSKASERLGRGTFGNAWSNLAPEEVIQKAATVPVTNIMQGGYSMCSLSDFTWSAMQDMRYALWGGYVNGQHVKITREEHMIRSANEAHRLGLLYGIQANYDPSDLGVDSGTMKEMIIRNIDGLGDKHIALSQKAIQLTNADFIDVLNEPVGDIDWYDANGQITCTRCSASEDYKNAYYNFLIKAIDAFRSVKPDIIVVVQGVPFWSLSSCIEKPIPRDNVVYAMHNYYSYTGEKPTYPQWVIDYWDGNFAQGKANLEKSIINDPLVPQALAKGMDVWYEETGCMIGNPNDEIAMKDYWDILDDYGLNFNILMNQPTWSDYPTVWLPDGSLSDVGQVWVNYMDKYSKVVNTCDTGLTATSSACSGTCCCSGTPSTCSSLSYPTDKWQRVWYAHSTGTCLGNGPDYNFIKFENDWVGNVVAYSKADDIEFHSSSTINLAAGTYTFTVGSDDGVRLWIDDQLKIDQWIERSYDTNSVTITFSTSGNHKFRLDWYENIGDARISFTYTSSTTPTGCDSTCKDQLGSSYKGTCINKGSVTSKLTLDKWTYIQVDNNRGGWGDYNYPSWMGAYLGLAMGDLTGDGYADIVSGRYFYRNPGSSMTGSWYRYEFDENIDAAFIVDVDGDQYGDIIAQGVDKAKGDFSTLTTMNLIWYEANDLQGNSWTMRRVIGSLPATSHATSQGYEVADVVPGGKPEILTSGIDGIYMFQIPANPLSDTWTITKIINDNYDSDGFTTGYINNDNYLDITGVDDGNSKNVKWWKNPGYASSWGTGYVIGQTVNGEGDQYEIVDIDEDGLNDIVVSEEIYPIANGASVFWFKNPGSPENAPSGSWTRKTVVTNGWAFNSMSAADMDNDGDVDVVSAEMGNLQRTMISENDGNGNFGSPIVVDTGKEAHLGAVVYDLNGDGKLDIVSIGWNEPQYLHVWRNDNTAPIVTTTREFSFVPIDNSGICGHYGSEDQSCAQFRAVGDIDGDGFNDIFAGQDGAGLFWYKYPSWTRYTIKNFVFWTGELESADIDNDGNIDVVAADNNNVIYWFENPRPSSPTNTWVSHSIGTLDNYAKELEIVDMNNDGKLDVVSRSFTFTSVFIQNSPTSWTKVKTFNHDPYVNWNTNTGNIDGMAVGDLDKDGDVDIVLNGFWAENPYPSLSGTWTLRSIDSKWYTQNTGYWADNNAKVRVADIDNNNRLDVIITQSEEPGYPISWYSTSDPKNGVWTEHVISNDIQYSHTLEVADMDNDGDMDIVAGKLSRHDGLIPGPFPQAVFYNNGNGASWTKLNLDSPSFYYNGLGTYNVGIYCGVLGDIGNDGDLDIIGTNGYWTGPIYYWENKLSTTGNPVVSPVSQCTGTVVQDSCPTGQECCCSSGMLTQKCSDNTPYGSCSASKPLYCSSGILINNCQQCGCSSGTCQSDGSCSGTTSGLVAYWKFDESSGTTAFDSSGNGNLGTLIGGPVWVSGKVGNGLKFDGTNDYVSVASSSSLDLQAPFTVEAWVYLTATPSTYNSIIYAAGSRTSSPWVEIELSLTSSRQVWWCTNTGSVQCFNSGSVPLNTWTHIAGTWDGTIMRSYVNGHQVGTKSLSGTVTEINNDALIGKGADQTEPQYFNGIIDELKVFNKALSASEVLAEYAS